MRQKVFFSLAVLLALVAFDACRKPMKVVLTKDQRIRIQDNILTEVPEPKYTLNANFDDKIKLIGVDVSADSVTAGSEITITYYWQVVKAVPGEWKIFGHLELPGGKRMVLDHVPVGELYPIGQWQAGEIIRDIQTVVVDRDANSGTAVLWGGIYNEEIYRTRGGGDRMMLVNTDQVPNDGGNRVQMAKIQIRAKASKPTPTLTSTKIGTEIVIDGKIDEEAWKLATPSMPFMTSNGSVSELTVTVKSVWDDTNLYFAFEVKDQHIGSTLKNRDDELWTQDCIEIYLDAKSDGNNYLEIQVSPANVVFDALFTGHRTPPWQEAKAHDIPGLKTAVHIDGTLNKDDDVDNGYSVEVAIPLASIPDFGDIPPTLGSTIRANFFRIDATGGKVIGASAFSPAGNDFHNLSKAGKVRFIQPAAE